jgi:DNA (cytosine-5)-methyltransferase 1
VNYLDLFSGIGGFAYGAWLAGMKFENHLFSEIEKYCIDLYQMRFPDSIYAGDITKIDTDELKNKYGNEWILTGGIPCQDISIAGKGAGIEGKRSGLWFEYWRIIRDLQPRFAIMENVPALTFRGLDRVLGSLAEIGYNAEWQIISAADMGAPHKRERAWIMAYPESDGNRRKQRKNGYSEKERFKKIGEKVRSFINNDSKSTREIPNTNGTGLERKNKFQSAFCESSGLYRKSKQWEIEPAVGRVANGIPHRVDRLKGLGNAILPQIAELLFNLIKDLT